MMALRLFEHDADALLFAPDDAAGQMTAVGHEREVRRDSDRARDVERGTGGGDVANRAIDRAAAELDGPAFQDPLSVCNPVFVHRIVLLQVPADSTAGFPK